MQAGFEPAYHGMLPHCLTRLGYHISCQAFWHREWGEGTEGEEGMTENLPDGYELAARCEKHGLEYSMFFDSNEEALEFGRRRTPPPCNTEKGIATRWEIVPNYNI